MRAAFRQRIATSTPHRAQGNSTPGSKANLRRECHPTHSDMDISDDERLTQRRWLRLPSAITCEMSYIPGLATPPSIPIAQFTNLTCQRVQDVIASGWLLEVGTVVGGSQRAGTSGSGLWPAVEICLDGVAGASFASIWPARFQKRAGRSVLARRRVEAANSGACACLWEVKLLVHIAIGVVMR
jgi:hypothetical protein